MLCLFSLLFSGSFPFVLLFVCVLHIVGFFIPFYHVCLMFSFLSICHSISYVIGLVPMIRWAFPKDGRSAALYIAFDFLPINRGRERYMISSLQFQIWKIEKKSWVLCPNYQQRQAQNNFFCPAVLSTLVLPLSRTRRKMICHPVLCPSLISCKAQVFGIIDFNRLLCNNRLILTEAYDMSR
jgi:hypothetical protein